MFAVFAMIIYIKPTDIVLRRAPLKNGVLYHMFIFNNKNRFILIVSTESILQTSIKYGHSGQ